VVDLEAGKIIRESSDKIHQNVYIPFLTLTAWMSYTKEGITLPFIEFNNANQDKPIQLKSGSYPVVIGEFPEQSPQLDESYIQISDALRFVQWAIENERFKKRGREKIDPTI
jgi:hypothetical protein